jgi:hypothetical protein
MILAHFWFAFVGFGGAAAWRMADVRTQPAAALDQQP